MPRDARLYLDDILEAIAQIREYLTQALEIFERLGTLIQPDKVKELAGLA